MSVITILINALRRIFGTDNFSEVESVRVFKDSDGKWHFQTPDGTITWGSYPTRADAVRAAKMYNFFDVID